MLIRVPSVQIVQIVTNVLNSLNVLPKLNGGLSPISTLCRGFSSDHAGLGRGFVQDPVDDFFPALRPHPFGAFDIGQAFQDGRVPASVGVFD